MAVLGNVAVNFIGRADKMLEASQKAAGGIDRIDKKLVGLQKGLSKAKAAFKTFGAAIIGAISVASIKSLVSNAADITDALTKQATAFREQSIFLGASIRNLRILGEVLEGDGLSAALADKSIDRMLKTMQKATSDPGALAVFNELGYTLSDLTRIIEDGDTAEELLKVANALNKVDNEGLKASLGQQLLGRQWRQMSEIAALYDGEIEEAAKSFTHLNIATDEQYQAAKNFQQALRDIEQEHETLRLSVLASTDNYYESLEAVTALKDEFKTITKHLSLIHI